MPRLQKATSQTEFPDNYLRRLYCSIFLLSAPNVWGYKNMYAIKARQGLQKWVIRSAIACDFDVKSSTTCLNNRTRRHRLSRGLCTVVVWFGISCLLAIQSESPHSTRTCFCYCCNTILPLSVSEFHSTTNVSCSLPVHDQYRFPLVLDVREWQRF